MVILQDDRHYFPPYQAVAVVRGATLQRHPEMRAPLDALSGTIPDDEMRRMNYAVDGEQREPVAVAREFRRTHGL
jgi:osmoprotectant transport system substrate-binding protein